MLAVTAIASAPQNMTRAAPAATFAPPARAARPPSSARPASDVAATSASTPVGEASPATSSGSAAPAAKLAAEVRRRLHRPRGCRARDAELVAGVRAERVVRHQLFGDLARERGVEPSADVDRRELVVLGGVVGLELAALALEVRLLGVRLRMHRHVLAGRHRHRAGDEPCGARDEDRGVARVGGRYAEH